MGKQTPQKNKRVVVNYLGRKGGGMVYAYEMTKGLIENGCEVCAIVPETIENLEMWKTVGLKDLVTIKTYSDKFSFVIGLLRFLLWDIWKVKHHFRNTIMDVCYVPMIQPWTIFINLLFHKSEIITTLHDPRVHEGSTWISKFIKYYAAKMSDKAIILSETFRQYTIDKIGFENHNIFMIPHGIFDYYEKTAANTVKPMTAKTNFLFFGRIEPYKGIDLLIKAYSRLEKEGHDISLRIVGSGDLSAYQEDLKELASLSVENRFVADEEVYQYFSGERTVVVLPYISATQSGVIPIAMQAGAQIIATDTGGLREQTCDGEYALLCNPNSDALVDAMREIVLHYEKYKQMRENSQSYVQTLSWNQLAKRLIDTFGD